jgi:hypothetical protein
MEGVRGFNPVSNVKSQTENTKTDSDVNFMQSLIDVAAGQKITSQIVYSGQGGSQLDFYSKPEKITGKNKKTGKDFDDIIADIEKIISQIKKDS